jgi:hypothetical protein
VLATTLDPEGRRVVLTEERWEHIRRRHGEVTPHLAEVLRAIREPDRRATGRRPEREFYFLEWLGPGRWLRVVVHYEGREGEVRTAYPEDTP